MAQRGPQPTYVDQLSKKQKAARDLILQFGIKPEDLDSLMAKILSTEFSTKQIPKISTEFYSMCRDRVGDVSWQITKDIAPSIIDYDFNHNSFKEFNTTDNDSRFAKDNLCGRIAQHPQLVECLNEMKSLQSQMPKVLMAFAELAGGEFTKIYTTKTVNRFTNQNTSPQKQKEETIKRELQELEALTEDLNVYVQKRVLGDVGLQETLESYQSQYANFYSKLDDIIPKDVQLEFFNRVLQLKTNPPQDRDAKIQAQIELANLIYSPEKFKHEIAVKLTQLLLKEFKNEESLQKIANLINTGDMDGLNRMLTDIANSNMGEFAFPPELKGHVELTLKGPLNTMLWGSGYHLDSGAKGTHMSLTYMGDDLKTLGIDGFANRYISDSPDLMGEVTQLFQQAFITRHPTLITNQEIEMTPPTNQETTPVDEVELQTIKQQVIELKAQEILRKNEPRPGVPKEKPTLPGLDLTQVNQFDQMTGPTAHRHNPNSVFPKTTATVVETLKDRQRRQMEYQQQEAERLSQFDRKNEEQRVIIGDDEEPSVESPRSTFGDGSFWSKLGSRKEPTLRQMAEQNSPKKEHTTPEEKAPDSPRNNTPRKK